MPPTRIDLSAVTRRRAGDLLAARLADAIDVRSQVKHAHWNVRGPSFIALHELFDKLAAELDEHADMIAERLIQLGGAAHGTVRSSAARSSLREYPHSAAGDLAHADAVSAALAAFAQACRAAIDAADRAGDAVTADLFTEVTRAVDKLVWLVFAHLPEIDRSPAATSAATPAATRKPAAATSRRARR